MVRIVGIKRCFTRTIFKHRISIMPTDRQLAMFDGRHPPKGKVVKYKTPVPWMERRLAERKEGSHETVHAIVNGMHIGLLPWSRPPWGPQPAPNPLDDQSRELASPPLQRQPDCFDRAACPAIVVLNTNRVIL